MLEFENEFEKVKRKKNWSESMCL